jgi:type I restriction enzyme S subunit
MENPQGKFPAEFNTYQEVMPNDLVMCLFDIDETPRCVGLSAVPGMITGAYTVLEPRASVVPEFIYKYYLAVDHQKHLRPWYTGLRKVVTRDRFMGIRAPLPPLDEQRAIADFLDAMDERVNRFTDARRRMIALLEEQKQAIINQSVTKGLDPDVPMKPSGIEWLGDVPAHWTTASLGQRYFVQLGKMLDAKQITGAHLIPYLRNADVQWDCINTENLPQMDIMQEEYERYLVSRDDLLVCEGGEVGRSAIWQHDAKVGFQKALHRVRPRSIDRDTTRFFYFVMLATAQLGIFASRGNENTFSHLTGEAFRAYRFAFPPLDEQFQIVGHLRAISSKLDSTKSKALKEIDLVQEYRTRLISDVVTGKLDVRGVGGVGLP